MYDNFQNCMTVVIKGGNKMRLGIDAGNYKVKICGERGLMDFISSIGEAREIKLHQNHGQDDMVFEYEGDTGFAGSLALYESEFSGSIMGDTKAHKDTLLRVLIGIHRYSTLYQIDETEFDIVVGQPISKHTFDEKDKLKEMLKGWHTITVNGIEKSFHIRGCEVAAEGVSAFFSNPTNGLVRILDIGSGTVNFSTILEGRFVDKDSGTLPFGVNTNKSNNLQALSRGIATHTLKKWDSNDNVFVVGGISETILPHLKQYFPNVEILYPIYSQQYVNPIYANAIAFYIVGVNVYV
jgi:plasmid segregation protein ParM